MKKSSTVSLVTVSLFASLSAIGAFIKIPLPYVPFTLQVLFVFLAGSLLGSKKGFQSQLIYVAIGLAGLPVFTQGGGIGYVLQPTFGYLIGFMAGAYVVGAIVERVSNPKIFHFIIANFAGLAVVYFFGVIYLYIALNTWMGFESSFAHAVMIGFVYSIAGDLVIAIIAGFLAVRLYKAFQSMEHRKYPIQKESSM
ncbi:biotin transporter BioY [Metabacillus litoralis]|uniref:biotin transporter BioY n=1 Tax=Metabacillus TaxID=2675233 RepID=UPI001B920794|nr:biotin transporter BioY [Metabacillus litoralis]MCM3409699.1 biotin transporter BioY [Metabacillus litoralis]UHA58734.1 biotin transporter BioY [Metabacillus litoralis]